MVLPPAPAHRDCAHYTREPLTWQTRPARTLVIEPSVARKVLTEFARVAPPARRAGQALPEPLSQRELEILALLSQGLTNREIAERLCLAQGTVKNYVTLILQKLGTRDRVQAAIRGREMGLL